MRVLTDDERSVKMETTLHSIERAKERTGMNPRAAEHFMRNALERGKDKSMFRCSQKRQWLAAKENACGYKALVYWIYCRYHTQLPLWGKGQNVTVSFRFNWRAVR